MAEEEPLAEIVARELAQRKKAPHDFALVTLDMKRFEFEKLGDDRAILSAINLCAANDIPLPTWLANAFTKKFRDVEAFKYSSWDAAFGPPYSRGSKKGKRGAGAKKQARQVRKELEIPVWLKIRELAARGVKTTDDDIFRQAADELKAAAGAKKTSHLTTSTVKRVYYAIDYFDHKSLERLVSLIAGLRRLGGDVEARAWVEAHFERHPYREAAIPLILTSQKFGK